MRNQFVEWVKSDWSNQANSIFLTGDVGFNAFESLQRQMKSRFINMGVAEQNMVGVAAGLARQGWSVICYSIAPFAVFRALEQIRLDICLHNLNVKIVGNGGGYGYGIMGAAHHALEDLATMSSLPGMRCLLPVSDQDVFAVCDSMFNESGPGYLRLNSSAQSHELGLPSFAPIRKLLGAPAPRVTVAALGALAGDLFPAVNSMGGSIDFFAVSELPFLQISQDLRESLAQTENLLVFEEHVARGGLGEHLAWHVAKDRIQLKTFQHRFALGYPDGLYGSQKYHQKQSGLDGQSLEELCRRITLECR